jgi:hypothetical protein
MENNRNELDELLKQSMQFSEGELPEPDKNSYNKLRKMIKPQNRPKNFFLRLLTVEIKLYQAGLALTAMAIVFIMLRPVQLPQNTNDTGSGSSDTAAAFRGSSLKHDTFLVKNFSTSIY